MSQLVSFVLLGVSQGMIYAAIALSVVLIFRATRIINFAQGALAMVSVYVAYDVIQRTGSYWLGLVAALAVGLVLGVLVERLLIRPLAGGPELNPVIVALGLLVLLEAAVPLVAGGQLRQLAPPFSRRSYLAGTTSTLSPMDLFAIVAVAVVAGLLLLLFRRTDLGLRMRAAALNPEVARLLGIRVSRLLTLGWLFAGLAVAVAGMLTAGYVQLQPTFMDAVFVYGFTAAVIGGLESVEGALVGGIGLGVGLSLVGGYLGTNLVPVAAFVILIVILMGRPTGLFGRSQTRAV